MRLSSRERGRARRPVLRVEPSANDVGPAVSYDARCVAPLDLSKLHEVADLTGAVRLVAVDRNALLPGGAGLRDVPCEPGFGSLNWRP